MSISLIDVLRPTRDSRIVARLVAFAFAALLTGCASLPAPVMPADENDPDTYALPDPEPMIESPPLEPVEPPLPSPPLRLLWRPSASYLVLGPFRQPGD